MKVDLGDLPSEHVYRAFVDDFEGAWQSVERCRPAGRGNFIFALLAMDFLEWCGRVTAADPGARILFVDALAAADRIYFAQLPAPWPGDKPTPMFPTGREFLWVVFNMVRHGLAHRYVQVDVSRRVTELEAMEARLVDLYARSTSITPAMIDAQVTESRAELAALRDRQAATRDERAHAARQEAEAQTVAKLIERLAARARNADAITRQRVLRALLARCDVGRVDDTLKVRAVFRFSGDGELPAATRTATGSSPRRA